MLKWYNLTTLKTFKNLNMEKEFIPYEQALALKELGFDEPCMSSRDMNNGEGLIQLPLYQQAFRWFREKYDLYHVITIKDLGKYEEGTPDFQCAIYSNYPVLITNMDKYKTYEEAELACLNKLIELIKTK